MAAWVEERVGRRFDRVVVDRTADDVPVVLAELTGEGPGGCWSTRTTTSLPAGDSAAWESDPFAAELRDGAVYARGTCDDKADITARLQAIDSGWTRTAAAAAHAPLDLRGRRGDRQPRPARGARAPCRLALRDATASGRASCDVRTGGPRSRWAAAAYWRPSSPCSYSRPISMRPSRRPCARRRGR